MTQSLWSMPQPPARMSMYNAADWYWIVGGSTTHVWSSKRAASVPIADAAYAEWAATGGGPPTIIATMQELRAVLSVQYPPGTLETYNAFKRWEKEQGGLTTTFGMPIKTDDRSQAKITGVWAAQQVNPAVVTPWHAADGTVRELTSVEMDQMNKDLLTHINACFDISQDVVTGLAGGAITTRQQIDNAYDAPLTLARKNWLKPTAKKVTKE